MTRRAARRRAAALVLAGAMLASAPAGTAQTAGPVARQFAVEGAGRLDCKAFTRSRTDKGSAEYQRFVGFIEGYLSAANRYEPNTFDLSPWHNAAAFDLILDKHCAAHPADPMVVVVQKMVSALRPVRVAEFSPLIEVGSGENRAFVYEAILRRSQAVLKARGLYRGPEDGKYSPQMREALLAFQKNSDLYQTGVPDPATLWTLLNP